MKNNFIDHVKEEFTKGKENVISSGFYLTLS